MSRLHQTYKQFLESFRGAIGPNFSRKQSIIEKVFHL